MSATPVEPIAQQRRDTLWSTIATLTAAVALLVAFVAVFANAGDGQGAGAEEGGAQTIEVTLGDLFVKPASISVPPGTELTVEVTNDGAMPHDLKLDGEVGTKMLDPGESETVSLGTMEESAQAWCTVPGHKEAGMVMDIEVAGAAAVAAGDGGHGSGQHISDSASGATIDFNAEPAADFTPYDPTLEPAPGGTEHKIELSAEETVIEVAPGVTQELWTFNEMSPGPMLRGKVGDIFTFTLTNNGEIGHSIDFHASKVAWSDEMRTIQPGESLVYQYEAKHAGVFMYHCGTAPALHHVGNGMFGAIVIDPPGLAPVDHEFIVVQSELYTGPDGEPGDLTKMQDEAHDAVVFNGYVNQYQHRPIRVEPGERVRLFVLDAGPSENSAFHVIGTIFDTVYKEGEYQLRPGAGRGGAQALDLQPSQGGFVEFTFDEPGLYPFVTHKFANVGKGALGIFQAGEVEAGAGGGH